MNTRSKITLGVCTMLTAGALSLAAQSNGPEGSCPGPRAGSPAGFGRMERAVGPDQLSPDAMRKIAEKQREIDAIRKADMEKQAAERKLLRTLKESYLAKPDETVKAQILAVFAARFDARVAARKAMLAKLTQDLADMESKRADFLEQRFAEFLQRNDAPGRGRIQRGGEREPRHEGKGRMERHSGMEDTSAPAPAPGFGTK